MASRRTRLKAVINLPVRRGRDDEQSPIIKALVEQKDHSTVKTQAPISKIPDATAPTKEYSGNDDKQSPKKALVQVQNDHSPIKIQAPILKIPDVATAPSKEYPENHTTDKSACTSTSKSLDTNMASEQSNVSVSTEQIFPTPSKTRDNNGALLSSLKVTQQARKRLKPTVSLLAVSRKSKERNAENESVTQKSQDSANIASIAIDQNLETLKYDLDSLCNDLSPSKVLAGHNNTKDTVQSLSKVPKSKFVKLAPRLLDASARRSSQGYVSETDSHLKLSHSYASQKVFDSTATSLPSQPVLQHNCESDEELGKCSESSYPPKKSLSSVKNSKQLPPLETSTVHGDLVLPDALASKTEKRVPTHRRPRKNGPGEILSIARRDFYKKFGTTTPDKKKLTMFDLIFYNPSSNPMKFDKSKIPLGKLSIERSSLDDGTNAERIVEENVDDVIPFDNEKAVPMPAPQVKVGPDGSLIIDEKSLVIETTGSRERKNELANSSIVEDYGTGSATYNSFTKKVKSKEWSKEETFKFYRALHSVGTDFLLMQSIFPNRTRADLKQKYKKEDRQNRDLVDKALRNPLEFDLTHLEKEIEQEEKENKQREEKLLEEKRRKKKTHLKSGKLKSHVADAITESAGITGGANKLKLIEKKYVTACSRGEEPSYLPPKKRKVSYKCSDSSSTSEDEDNLVYLTNTNEDENENEPESVVTGNSDDDNSNDNDCENKFLLLTPQPTRSGRIPQTRNSSDYTPVATNNGMEVMKETSAFVDSRVTHIADSALSQQTQSSINIPSLQSVEPGSLVILSTPGQNTLQLFMVAPRGGSGMPTSITHIPVAITPEILQSVSSSIGELRSSEPPSSDDTFIASDDHDT